MNIELYKIRSFSSCINVAYEIYINNIKTILRKTWLPALLFSASSAIAIILLHYGITFLLSAPTPIHTTIVATFCFTILFCLLAAASKIWFDTIIIALLGNTSVKLKLPRIIRLAVVMFAIGLTVGIISIAVNFIPAINTTQTGALKPLSVPIIISCAIYIALAIAIIPLFYSSIKYIVETENKLSSIFGKPYRIGWQHWGYIFMLCLLIYIILSVVYFVVSLPATISFIAFMANAESTILGDTSNLPVYFKILAWFASAISSLILIYAETWFIIVLYYAYGHIEAKEKAKRTPSSI